MPTAKSSRMFYDKESEEKRTLQNLEAFLSQVFHACFTLDDLLNNLFRAVKSPSNQVQPENQYGCSHIVLT